MMVICGKCQTGFEPTHDGTICANCLKRGLRKPPLPKVVWEGKCWADGQECISRAVLSWREDGKTEVIFEYTRDKDAMKQCIWKRLNSTPDQFVTDAASMMDTASTPNRT